MLKVSIMIARKLLIQNKTVVELTILTQMCLAPKIYVHFTVIK